MIVQRNDDNSGNIGLLTLSYQPYVFLVLLVSVLLFPKGAFAECKELKIVEYEDRVEAICVGEPLTEEQKKAYQEEERRQEAAAQRQRLEEQRRQRETDAANKIKEAKEAAKAAGESKKRITQPVVPQKPVIKNTINPNKF